MAKISNAVQILNEENPGKFGLSKIKKRIWDAKGINEPGGTRAKDFINSYNKSIEEFNRIIDKITETSKDEVAELASLKNKASGLKKEIGDYESRISKELKVLASKSSSAEVASRHKEVGKEAEEAESAAKEAREKADYLKKGKGGYSTYKKLFAKNEDFKDRVKSYLPEAKKFSGGRVCEECGSKKNVKDVKGTWKCKACAGKMNCNAVK